MNEKSTMKFIKERVQELGLQDKLDFFHWLMVDVLKDLKPDVAKGSEHIKET